MITGHTGFKGAWLVRILKMLGAEITGFALPPNNEQKLFSSANSEDGINSIYGDIRNIDDLKFAFIKSSPDIAIHMAAQPLVRDSYLDPKYTYETNVIGTVNFFECVRESKSVRSVLNVTTDKVYKNKEWNWGYREYEELNGFDPYSNSKSCSELVTQTYIRSFFEGRNISISTARSGNVIGGGDFSSNRIVPDCIKAAITKDTIIVRNPYSIRPYQHVLEPLFAYLLIIEKQYDNQKNQGSYNVGPEEKDCVTTGSLVEKFCLNWPEEITWINKHSGGPHEAQFLKLDISKIMSTFNWTPIWDLNKAVIKSIDWTISYQKDTDTQKIMDLQISEYLSEFQKKVRKLL